MKRALLTAGLLLALPAGVAAQSAPDLVVLGPNVSKSSLETGVPFWFIATVVNDGYGRSAATMVRYYRSTDATITPSDTEEGMDPVAPKGRHQGYGATIRLTAPSTAGTYYYGACVDAVPGESDTANNCSSAVPVTVSAGGGGGGGGPTTSVPGAPRNLTAVGGNGEVVLSWDAPASDGGAEITDYEYRINGQGSTGSPSAPPKPPIRSPASINGTAYTFQVRAVNRIGTGRSSSTRPRPTPEAPEVFTLDFAHFANGALPHLRSGIRECGNPSDPSRPLLLRSRGPARLPPNRW